MVTIESCYPCVYQFTPQLTFSSGFGSQIKRSYEWKLEFSSSYPKKHANTIIPFAKITSMRDATWEAMMLAETSDLG